MSDILIPSFGESITAATVAAWHKGAGDAVARGDTLVTLETDKVSTDLEADEDGMLEILVPEGAEAPIGAVLGRIAPSAGTSVPEKEEATVLPEPENTPQPDVKRRHLLRRNTRNRRTNRRKRHGKSNPPGRNRPHPASSGNP